MAFAYLTQLEYLAEQDALEDAYILGRPQHEDQALESIPEELIVLLNTLLLSEQEMNNIRTRRKLPKANLTPDSASLLLRICEKREEEYLKTTTEDSNLLGSQPAGHQNRNASSHEHAPTALPERIRMAIEVRQAETSVLHQIKALLQELASKSITGGKRRASAEQRATSPEKRVKRG